MDEDFTAGEPAPQASGSNEQVEEKPVSNRRNRWPMRVSMGVLALFLAAGLFGVYYYFTSPTVVGYYTMSKFKASAPEDAEVIEGLIVKQDGEYSLWPTGENGKKQGLLPIPTCSSIDTSKDPSSLLSLGEVAEKVEESGKRSPRSTETLTQFVFSFNSKDDEERFYKLTEVAIFTGCEK